VCIVRIYKVESGAGNSINYRAMARERERQITFPAVSDCQSIIGVGGDDDGVMSLLMSMPHSARRVVHNAAPFRCRAGLDKRIRQWENA
jgi:hypothetical protein